MYWCLVYCNSSFGKPKVYISFFFPRNVLSNQDTWFYIIVSYVSSEMFMLCDNCETMHVKCKSKLSNTKWAIQEPLVNLILNIENPN